MPVRSKSCVLVPELWISGASLTLLSPTLQGLRAAGKCWEHCLIQEIMSDAGWQADGPDELPITSVHWMFQPQRLQT